ncbi:hypothetical protein MJD09_27340, partial [bacterium]|nr:hypothetical protein [bacterium]
MRRQKLINCLRRIGSSESGYVLGLIMIFFVVFTIMGLGFIKMSRHERVHAFNDYYKEKAYYNAQAGIHKGIWLASKVSAAAASFSDATVTVTYDSANAKIKAVGISGSVQDSIQATLNSTAGEQVRHRLLLVVRNPSSLTSQESKRKTLIESWGYTVTL